MNTISDIFLLTDGMNRDFGLEGIQALSPMCTKIIELKTRHCFQLHTLALKAISSHMHNIKILDLSFCPKIDYSATIHIARGCPLIEKFIVIECSKFDDKVKNFFIYIMITHNHIINFIIYIVFKFNSLFIPAAVALL